MDRGTAGNQGVRPRLFGRFVAGRLDVDLNDAGAVWIVAQAFHYGCFQFGGLKLRPGYGLDHRPVTPSMAPCSARYCSVWSLTTAGVVGHGPSSKVKTTSLSRKKSCCLKCSKPNSVSDTRIYFDVPARFRGIVSKRRDLPYRSGRAKSWLKQEPKELAALPVRTERSKAHDAMKTAKRKS